MSHLGWIDSFVLAPAYSHCYQTGFGSDCVEHFSLWKVNVVNTNWQFTSLLRICLCAHNEYARCHMSYQRVERIASSRGDLNCASASGACCQQGWLPQWKADEVKNYFMFFLLIILDISKISVKSTLQLLLLLFHFLSCLLISLKLSLRFWLQKPTKDKRSKYWNDC